MVVGIGEENKEFFISSDTMLIAEYTSHVVYIDDEQIVKIERGKEMEISNLQAEHFDVDVTEIDVD